MKEIGIISDTHLSDNDINKKTGMFKRLETMVNKYFNDVDAIIHCGDITSPQVIKYLEDFAPTHAVMGNCDANNLLFNNLINEDKGIEEKDPWPKVLHLSFEGVKFSIAHDRKDLFQFVNEDTQVFLFGHSHTATIEFNKEKGQYFINPGSLKRPASRNPEVRKPSIALLQINAKENNIKEKIRAEICYLD